MKPTVSLTSNARTVSDGGRAPWYRAVAKSLFATSTSLPVQRAHQGGLSRIRVSASARGRGPRAPPRAPCVFCSRPIPRSSPCSSRCGQRILRRSSSPSTRSRCARRCRCAPVLGPASLALRACAAPCSPAARSRCPVAEDAGVRGRRTFTQEAPPVRRGGRNFAKRQGARSCAHQCGRDAVDVVSSSTTEISPICRGATLGWRSAGGDWTQHGDPRNLSQATRASASSRAGRSRDRAPGLHGAAHARAAKGGRAEGRGRSGPAGAAAAIARRARPAQDPRPHRRLQEELEGMASSRNEARPAAGARGLARWRSSDTRNAGKSP